MWGFLSELVDECFSHRSCTDLDVHKVLQMVRLHVRVVAAKCHQRRGKV